MVDPSAFYTTGFFTNLRIDVIVSAENKGDARKGTRNASYSLYKK